MELLTYNQAYEAQVVELWNQELFADPITVHKFRQQALLDDNFDSDLCYVAQEDGKTVGFLLATKRKFPYLERGTEPERGWINAMFVAGEYQGKGIGTKLLMRAEADLKARGGKEHHFGGLQPKLLFP